MGGGDYRTWIGVWGGFGGALNPSSRGMIYSNMLCFSNAAGLENVTARIAGMQDHQDHMEGKEGKEGKNCQNFKESQECQRINWDYSPKDLTLMKWL